MVAEIGVGPQIMWVLRTLISVEKDNFTSEEIEIIKNLHGEGNGWAQIAAVLNNCRTEKGRRTANQVKNYWYQKLSKTKREKNNDLKIRKHNVENKNATLRN
ncbi:12491_t:CDS:2 [Acaulospora colombiana]|uniref:12491_t:CDS:1 n=1 Tax=Acaulospora colombiana TaxID=27376 RepID=A0ACA9KPX5_9GLOM|nr:12491_t:CDS:2 [Acaulospora colombiana]